MLNEINPVFTVLLYLVYFIPALVFFYFYSKTSEQSNHYEKRKSNPAVNLQVEGLRGVLSFSVFIHHCVISFSYYRTQVWTAPASHFYDKLGSCPVILFFFLTGYLFFEEKMRARFQKMKYTDFIKKRFLRIYPAYIFSVALVMFFIFFKTHFTLLEDALTILKSMSSWILVGLPNGVFQDINKFEYSTIVNAGVIWSLRYEVLFYLLCPLFVAWYAKNTKNLIWIFLFCAIIYATKSYGWQMLFDFSKFMILGFSGGMFVAAYQKQIQQFVSDKKLEWPLLVVSVLLMSVSEKYNIFETLGMVGIFILIINQFKFFNFLARPLFVELGRVSYSFYLLHGIVIYAVFSSVYLPDTVVSQVGTIAGLGVVVSLISILSFKFIEQRFYKL